MPRTVQCALKTQLPISKKTFDFVMYPYYDVISFPKFSKFEGLLLRFLKTENFKILTPL